MSRKFVETEIGKINELAATLKRVEESGDANDMFSVCTEINIHVLQALLGCEVASTKKGETKVKFKHALPSLAQVAEIAHLCDNNAQVLAASVETIGDDDMSIDVDRIVQEIPVLEGKITNKIMSNFVLDKFGAAHCILNGSDCITIASYGAEARNNANIKKALIGGIALLVIAGGVTAAVVIRKKKHQDEDVVETEVTAVEVEEDIDDAPVVDLDEDTIE